MNIFKEKFNIRNDKFNLIMYLGMEQKWTELGKIKVCSEKYIKESISQVEKRLEIEIRKGNVIVNSKLHPELDDTLKLNEANITEYQKLIGILQQIQS